MFSSMTFTKPSLSLFCLASVGQPLRSAFREPTVLKGGGGRCFESRQRSRETWRLRATHPFALAFSYVLLTVLPLYHAKTYKESDVRSCLFRQFIFPVLYPFSNGGYHPEAIYLICFSMR